MSQKKVALVTGVSSGIGRATAVRLLEQGFRAFGTLREMSRAKGIDNGAHPSTVALVVLKSLTSRSPRLRYPAGREAKFLSFLRNFAPSRLFDRGLRKQFRLEGAS